MPRARSVYIKKRIFLINFTRSDYTPPSYSNQFARGTMHDGIYRPVHYFSRCVVGYFNTTLQGVISLTAHIQAQLQNAQLPVQ